MALNTDQKYALTYLKDWWKCPSMYVVIDSAAGTGKTYLVNTVLQELKGATPILLAPTNEALNQLRDKTEGDYLFKTVHSALGITPTTSQADIEFKHGSLPSLWEDYDLAVIDEASMLSDFLLNLLISTGIKMIFLGHRSQLPPIDIKRHRNDPCISPVFAKGWDTLALTIPQRNTGKLWEYNNIVESIIYDDKILLPKDYNVSKKAFIELTTDKETIGNFLEGETKIALWKNTAIDRYNMRLREVIFGERARTSLYLPRDNIILTSPLIVIDDLPRHTDYALKNLMPLRDELAYLYSNAKAVVQKADRVKVTLNKELSFFCHKLDIIVEGDFHTIYSIEQLEDLTNIATYYEHLAWNAKTTKTKAKRYRERHFILSCFANIKHSYAMSSHRLQGSSIPNVIAIRSNILENPCKVERKKCFYVSTSRAMKNLYVYNGA